MLNNRHVVWSDLRAMLVGWLVCALLLPTLLGFIPIAKASAADDLVQVSESQLCTQIGHLANGDGKPTKSQHNHDCPCCLPSGLGQVALPPYDVAVLSIVTRHKTKLGLVEFVLRHPANRLYRLAPARAPPVFLSL